jgi:hypothetical protein
VITSSQVIQFNAFQKLRLPSVANLVLCVLGMDAICEQAAVVL